MNTRDRRIDPRTPVKAPARLWAEGREVGLVQIADVSKSGVFIKHDGPDLPSRSRITLQMVVSNQKFDLLGEVVHVIRADQASNRAAGYGVQLINPPADVVARISAATTVESVGLKPAVVPRSDSKSKSKDPK